MPEQRTDAPTEDSVCGVRVDPDEARGKGCLLELRDDPVRFLDPAYAPSM